VMTGADLASPRRAACRRPERHRINWLRHGGLMRARIDPDTSEKGDGEERTAVEIMSLDVVEAASL
jgi:hypothetical protein